MLKDNIWEKYSKVKTLVGSKNYSTVYKVKNKSTGNYYVIKEILNTYYNKDFLNKIKNLKTENNVIINEIIETNEKIYIVHELCEFNLDEYLKSKSKNFTNEEIKGILNFDLNVHLTLQKISNVAGGMFGGKPEKLLKFIELYYKSLNLFAKRKIFIGKDQNIFTYISLSHPDIVKLIYAPGTYYFNKKYLS